MGASKKSQERLEVEIKVMLNEGAEKGKKSDFQMDSEDS